MDLPTESEPVKVVCGDALDILRTLPDGAFDAVITDPPYGIGAKWQGGGTNGWGRTDAEKVARNEWDDRPPPNEVWGHLTRVAGKVVVWGGNHFPLPPSRGWFVWVKPERGFTLSEAELAWTNIDTVVRCFDAPRHVADRKHPTQKPVALIRWCIRQMKLAPGSMILDPFAGSGTTGIAAALEGRRAVLVEKEPLYVDITGRRVAKVMGKGGLFAGLGD
jgi:site-specific DNA-methyltransferase (adenine-specific)